MRHGWLGACESQSFCPDKTRFGVQKGLPHTVPGLEAYWDLGLCKALEFRLMVL